MRAEITDCKTTQKQGQRKVQMILGQTTSTMSVIPLQCLLIGVLLGTGASGTERPTRGDHTGPAIQVQMPHVILRGLPFRLTLRAAPAAAPLPYRVTDAAGRELAEGALAGGEERTLENLRIETATALPLTLTLSGEYAAEMLLETPPVLPGWTSLLPPLVAIALAFVLREVVTSLFTGVFLGAFLYFGLDPLIALWRTMDHFIAPALGNEANAAIVIFSMLLGGMVGVMSRCGGTLGIVRAVGPLATTPRRALGATFCSGGAIFFDDFANTLIVGNTMRPLTDRLRISREKLAYIVDSTAAPVVTLAFVSTWAGFLISLIGDSLATVANQANTDPGVVALLTEVNPFVIYLRAVPYMFYPILSLIMVALVVGTGRDFGPMRQAERRARAGGGVSRPGALLLADTSGGAMDPAEGAPPRWINAAAPILTVIGVVLGGLYLSGRSAAPPGADIYDVIGAANPFHVLMWGSLAGCLVAIALAVSQRILTPNEALAAWLGGLRAMILAMVILILAWSISEVTDVLGTADYLSRLLSDRLPPPLLPASVFITAMGMSFATGTSWGTMAILTPLVVPLAVAMGGAEGFDTGYTILLGSISSVLAGAVFGDHCSPISDTTVMSSMASACDHMDHVRTQAPYALLVATVGLVTGDLATAFLGAPLWLSYMTGGLILLLVLHLAGRPVDR